MCRGMKMPSCIPDQDRISFEVDTSAKWLLDNAATRRGRGGNLISIKTYYLK